MKNLSARATAGVVHLSGSFPIDHRGLDLPPIPSYPSYPLSPFSLPPFPPSHTPHLLSQTIPQGERSKSRLVKSEVEDWMLERRCGRDTCLVCVGGGVVGDLGGFIAASFMRGIPFVQVPTSFLAMVDSSVGGKTGIDVGAGKNLVGAFHRPLAVLEDVSVLQTLPLRHLVNGLAESVKAGAIRSLPLFELIESHVAEILAYDQATLVEVIHQSVAIKAEVVAADEFEGGVRAILNFGHTIGHAVEALMQPMLLHGECVSIGMRLEAEVARTLGLLTSGDLRRLVGLCHGKLFFPIDSPLFPLLSRA